MPIEVQCGGCGKRYNVGDQFAGKKAKCKNCGAVMVVPQPVPVEAAPDMDYDALAALESTGQIDESAAVQVAPPPLPPKAGATFTAPRGAVIPPLIKAVNRAPGRRIGFRINRLILALMIGGGALGFFGLQEMRLAAASSEQPQTLSCSDLEKNGPGKNAHIHLTKFTFTRHYIFERDKNNANADCKTVWNPLVATDGAYFRSLKVLVAAGKLKPSEAQDPTNILVLMKTHKIPNESLRESFVENTNTLDGMVINDIDSLKGEEKRLLEDSFPGADFSKVWIFEEGREPASPAKYLAMLGGGLALILAGLFFMLKPA